MDILNQIKKIVLPEVSDEIKSLQLHKLLANFSSDWTVKYSRKAQILDYRIVLKDRVLIGNESLV